MSKIKELSCDLFECYAVEDEPTSIMSLQRLKALLTVVIEDEQRERMERLTCPAGPMALRKAAAARRAGAGENEE